MPTYKSPPTWAVNLLGKILPPDLVDEVEGDLYEAFQWRASERGIGYARRKYLTEVFKCLRHFRIKFKVKNYRLMLIQNYLKTGFRFLWKTRGYSSLNILGLALGIAISWLAFIFITDEYSYDAFYPNADDLYRISAHMQRGDETHTFAGSSYMMGTEFPEQIPGIAQASRFKSGFFLIEKGGEHFNQAAHYADPAFFDMFSVDFIAGGPNDFSDPNTIVISESTARSLSNTIEAVEQITLIVGTRPETFLVSGVYKDFPTNTSIQPEILIPFSYWANANQRRTTMWFDINMNTFFQLDKNISPEAIGSQMTQMLIDAEVFEDVDVSMGLQPLTDIHLNADLRTGNGIGPRGDNELVVIVSIIGIFCLVIACVNYANFAVGNYLVRLKEVAVRKVFGAEKVSVFNQFVTEAFISAFLALLLSIAFIYVMLPGFSNYADKSYSMDIIFNQEVLTGGILILTVSTLLAGIYPALLLSRYKTIAGLKGKSKLGGKNWLSRGLVTLQFAIAVFLIAGMLTLDRQLNFLLDYDLGYSGENLIRVFRPMEDKNQMDRFKNEILSIPGVASVSIASGFNGTDFQDDEGNRVEVGHARIDPDYIKTMGMTLVTGRDFDPSLGTDYTKACIVNEAFLQMAGIENPVGQQINFNYGDFDKPTIIGVVKDFNFESLHSHIEPMILYMGNGLTAYDNFIKVGQISPEIIQKIEDVHTEMFAPYPFELSFVEDDIAEQYALESNIQKMSRAGASVAIFLSCIGLMGFVGTQIRQKLKEVSIRKVVGARPHEIFGLYLSRYLLLLGIGMAVGLTGAIYIMQDWLANYPQKIAFSFDIGLIALGSVLLVALLTIFTQLAKAIKLNPVVYLKDE